ncbi:MAG: hypothetical protein HQK89_15635 [Nitrospirae bacterium]|nr:hypothetical protein [Nitrospirota bacterium]
MANNRYEDVPEEILSFVDTVRNKYFPELSGLKINVLYDLKKRTNKGKLVLGNIKKTDDLIRHHTKSEFGLQDGYDFILFLDKFIFNHIDDNDKVRLIRHQFRHVFYDSENDKDPYRLVGHDVEDFFEELQLNKDDMRWAERVMEVAMALYEEDKENTKGPAPF